MEFDFTKGYIPRIAEIAKKEKIAVLKKGKNGTTKKEPIGQLLHRKNINVCIDKTQLKMDEELNNMFPPHVINPYRGNSVLGYIYEILLKELNPKQTEGIFASIGIGPYDYWENSDGSILKVDSGIWSSDSLLFWHKKDSISSFKPIRTFSLSIPALCNRLKQTISVVKWSKLIQESKMTKGLSEEERAHKKVLEMIKSSQRTDLRATNCLGLPASQCGMVLETHYVDDLNTVYVRLAIGLRHPQSEGLRDARKRLKKMTTKEKIEKMKIHTKELKTTIGKFSDFVKTASSSNDEIPF